MIDLPAKPWLKQGRNAMTLNKLTFAIVISLVTVEFQMLPEKHVLDRIGKKVLMAKKSS